MSDDDSDTTEGGMSVASVAVLSALAVVAALIWLTVFHAAGTGRGLWP